MILTTLAGRIFEMRVADVLPKLRHGNHRILLAPYVGVMSVPKQGQVRGVGLLENLEQRGRTDKVAVGFDQHRNTLRTGIVAKLHRFGGVVEIPSLLESCGPVLRPHAQGDS